MSNHHDDEPLFPLELGEARQRVEDIQQRSIEDDSLAFDNDDDNRFVDNDTGVDLTQPR